MWRCVCAALLLQGGRWWAASRAPRLMTTHLVPQLIGEEEDVSVYDIADHPDFRFRTTDIVIRIGNTEDGALPKEDEVPVSRPLLPIPCSSCSAWWCHQVAPGDKTYKSPARALAPGAFPAEQLHAAKVRSARPPCLPAGVRLRVCAACSVPRVPVVGEAVLLVLRAVGAQERPGEVASARGLREQVGTVVGIGQVPAAAEEEQRSRGWNPVLGMRGRLGTRALGEEGSGPGVGSAAR